MDFSCKGFMVSALKWSKILEKWDLEVTLENTLKNLMCLNYIKL